jgi:hypothetical protein
MLLLLLLSPLLMLLAIMVLILILTGITAGPSKQWIAHTVQISSPRTAIDSKFEPFSIPKRAFQVQDLPLSLLRQFQHIPPIWLIEKGCIILI